MPQSSYAHAPQLLSQCSGACELKLMSPQATTMWDQSPRWAIRDSTEMRGLLTATGEKTTHGNEDPAQPKINRWIFFEEVRGLVLEQNLALESGVASELIAHEVLLGKHPTTSRGSWVSCLCQLCPTISHPPMKVFYKTKKQECPCGQGRVPRSASPSVLASQ